MWLTDPILGSAANGILDGPGAGITGKFLTYTKYGDIHADLTGTYDGTDNSWQARAGGLWKNSQDLAFNGIIKKDDLRRTVEGYDGHWDDGGSFYDYRYDAGVQGGWSVEYDANTDIETHVEYRSNGTRDTWSLERGTGNLTYLTDTWGGDLYLDYLRGGSSIAGPVDRVGPDYVLNRRGWIGGGLMGGLDDLWAATDTTPAGTVFMGEYELKPLAVFSLNIRSYNPYDDSFTILNPADNTRNGAYYGYMGGRLLGDDATLDARILSLYVDPNGNFGMLKGDAQGNAYRGLELWDATGTIYPIELVQNSGFAAADLEPGNILFEDFDEGPTDRHGEFIDMSTGDYYGDIHRTFFSTVRARIKTTGTLALEENPAGAPGVLTHHDQYFSIRPTLYGGTYSDVSVIGSNTGGPFDHWYLPSGHDDGVRYTQGVMISTPDAPADGLWSNVGGNNVISGNVHGSWVHWNEAVTGLYGGDLKGTFNPANQTWQTSSLTASMDTRTFLSLTETIEGKNKLHQLNIPSIEVGRADLTGSYLPGGGNAIDVRMYDTTFFKYRDGSRPRVWATNAVYGNTNYAPSAGTVIPLTGSNLQNVSGLSADFNIRNWDSPAGKWGAYIQNGVGTVGGYPINFSGGAAGNVEPGIDPRTQGATDFSGTASGTARRQ